MKFPIAIEPGNEQTATGIHIPDIAGVATAGDSLEEAYNAAIEVAHIMLDSLVEQGLEIPTPSSVEEWRHNPDYEGMTWALLEIDVTPYLGATEKVNVTLPGTIVRKIDQYVEQHGLRSRSSFLAEAALEKMRAVSLVH